MDIDIRQIYIILYFTTSKAKYSTLNRPFTPKISLSTTVHSTSVTLNTIMSNQPTLPGFVSPEIVILSTVYSPDMDTKITGPGKELVADVTLVFLKSSMDLQMPLQFTFSDESLATLLAYKWFFFRMGERMQF